MSILTAASSTSVIRGFDYYKSGKVKKVKELSEIEYEAYVDGSESNNYYVKINILKPKTSHCDCPHANGNVVCKHMVALYFQTHNEEAEDYEAWRDGYYDEYGYESWYDDYDYSPDYDEKPPLPIFLDDILEKYVDSLKENELKKILLTELKNDKERAYDLYLYKVYNKLLKTENKDLSFIEDINKKVKSLIYNIDYDKDIFYDEIFTEKERKK